MLDNAATSEAKPEHDDFYVVAFSNFVKLLNTNKKMDLPSKTW